MVLLALTVVVVDPAVGAVEGEDAVLPACSCWILSCRESVLAVVDPMVVLLV